MRAVFKLKGIILICALLTIQLPAFAMMFGEYGQASISDYMEWTTIETTYTYGLNCIDASGQNVATPLFSVSSDSARSGIQSMKLDTSSMGTGWRAQIIRSVSGTSVYGSAFCFEAYVKGYTSKPDGLTLSFNFSDGNSPINFNSAPYNVVCHYDDADSSGWHRIWATIPYFRSTNNGNVCIQYIKSAGDNFTALYVDDVILRPLPVKMVINDITSNFNNSVSLNSIRVKGFDMYNNERDVVNTQLIKWSVLSGSASIDSNNNLIYSGASSGNVKLKADFYGITAQTTVQFGTSLNVSAISKSGKSYKANITNTSGNTVNASIIAALYDGSRLYNVYNTSKCFRAGETADIMTPAVNIPKWVEVPVTKVYVWDDIFGMRAYSDAEDLFFNFTDNFSYDQSGGTNINGKTFAQNWQNSSANNGGGQMSSMLAQDSDNDQNKVMQINPGNNWSSGVNLMVDHSGISSSKVVQVDICGLQSAKNQKYGIGVMEKTGAGELDSVYQLYCVGGTCSFLKYNASTATYIPLSSTSNMPDMNKWYTFKLVLNGSQISWSITAKDGSYSWSDNWTDSSPLSVSEIQLFAGGTGNPNAVFDNFVLRGYDPSID